MPARRAADRLSRSNAIPPKFTCRGAPSRQTATNRVTAGREGPPNTAYRQQEAPTAVRAVVGASFASRGRGSGSYESTRMTDASAVLNSRAGRGASGARAPSLFASTAGSVTGGSHPGSSGSASSR